jgi:hypothetical protein
VRERFAEWRRKRKPRTRIPGPLWAAAVKMVGKYGLHRTARALRVDYYSLKRRVEEASASTGRPTGGNVATFVELAGPPTCTAIECRAVCHSILDSRTKVPNAVTDSSAMCGEPDD